MTTSIIPSYELADNEMPLPALPSVVESLGRAAATVRRYPAPDGRGLVERLAEVWNLPAGSVVVGPGSGQLCQHIARVACPDGGDMAYGWPSFEAYPLLARLTGARPVPVPLTDAGEYDLGALSAAGTARTRLFVVCNPNNPTGTLLSRAAIEAFLDRVSPETVVLLDEAYAEFADGPECPHGIDLVRTGRYQNLVVTRTFSKAYGLAGLRVGYCVGAPRLVAAVRGLSLPFSVNALGLSAAVASLDAGAELAARCASVTAERDRVGAALRAAGFAVPPSSANFVWLPLRDGAEDFRDRCAARGVAVRAFAGEGVRVTIGLPEANDAFLAVATG